MAIGRVDRGVARVDVAGNDLVSVVTRVGLRVVVERVFGEGERGL